VKFARKGAKPGKMPTNYIIEYNVKDAEQIGMACERMGGGRAPASPNCPPGILRYFFGVKPLWLPSMKPPQGYASADHGAAFFNFMLDTCFPLLKAKFALQDDSTPAKDPRSTRPTAFGTDEAAPALVPAVMQSTMDRPRLRNVLALTDCAEGGIIVETDVAASVP